MTGAQDGPWTPFTWAEVVKCDRDRDFYVAWSHITEAPTWAGTYAEAFMAGCDMDRLDRAIVNGSSFHPLDRYGQPQPGLWWDAAGLIAEQLGYLPRAKLAAYVTAYARGRYRRAYGMLERFEDVRPREHRARVKEAALYQSKTDRAARGRGPLAAGGREYRRRQVARNRRKR